MISPVILLAVQDGDVGVADVHRVAVQHLQELICQGLICNEVIQFHHDLRARIMIPGPLDHPERYTSVRRQQQECHHKL